MAKIKHFQVLMPMDWKLNYEFNEVWHSSFGPIFLLWHPKHWFFKSKKKDSDFSQKYDFSLRFFNHSLGKSRRTAKRSTVLSSLLQMLTITTTSGKI